MRGVIKTTGQQIVPKLYKLWPKSSSKRSQDDTAFRVKARVKTLLTKWKYVYDPNLVCHLLSVVSVG